MKGRYVGKLNPFYGKKHTAETIEKLKKPKSESTKNKLRDANKNRAKVECPNCKLLLDIGNAKRWHFSNCKK